ncbi:MAG: SPW repeat protein [Planctomycetaceae bacterium]
MWSRVVEVMLGVWLALSPFIFRHPGSEQGLWLNDLLCALAVITAATLSFWRPTGYAHLLQLVIAVWLIGFGYFAAPHPTPAALQNNIIVGLMLLMFGIIPNDASHPPEAWRGDRMPETDNDNRATLNSNA